MSCRPWLLDCLMHDMKSTLPHYCTSPSTQSVFHGMHAPAKTSVTDRGQKWCLCSALLPWRHKNSMHVRQALLWFLVTFSDIFFTYIMIGRCLSLSKFWPAVEHTHNIGSYWSFTSSLHWAWYFDSQTNLFAIVDKYGISQLTLHQCSRALADCRDIISIVVTSSKYVGNFDHRSHFTWSFEQVFFRFIGSSMLSQFVNKRYRLA